MDASAASSGLGALPASARQEDVEAAQPKAKAHRRPRGRILNRPTIDLDSSIEAAKQAARDASKALALARSEARANRKRRARLLNKAATLSVEDLDRIAVLKRTGRHAPTETEEKQDEATLVTSDADANKMKSASANPTTEGTRTAKKQRVTEQEQRTSGDEAGAGEESEQEDAEHDEAKDGEDDEE